MSHFSFVTPVFYADFQPFRKTGHYFLNSNVQSFGKRPIFQEETAPVPVVHIIGNLVLIGVFLTLGIFAARRRETAIVGIVGFVVITLLGVLIILRPDLFLFVLPFGDLIFYSNWFPFGAALLIPCVFQFGKGKAQKIRIGVLLSVLFVLTLKEYDYHFMAPAKSYDNVIDEDGVCRQSSVDTCSAAALVTYVRIFGYSITESEAIELARTKEKVGTIHLGLYHALKILSRLHDGPTPRVKKLPLEKLLSRNQPAIVTVGLPRRGNSEEAIAFGEKYDWRPGVLHDVVFLGLDNDREGYVLIGEPDYGLESWPIEHLRYLYYGFAIYYEE